MWKNLLEAYSDKNGHNPFSAGLSLFTFTKSIPWHIFKAVGLGLLIFVAMMSLLVYLDANILLIIIASIVGFLGMVAMIVTGVMKFITDDFMSNVEEFFSGILSPIDDLYSQYQSEGNEAISKKDFASKVFKDAIGPMINDKLGSFPFGKKIKDGINGLMEDITNDDEFQAATKAGDLPMPQLSLAAPVTRVVNSSRRKINTPFSKTLKWVGIVWLVIYVIFALFKYVL